ncbi:LETM1 and EF-hand domain-containing protein [Actinidia chinensis var. chinensis]|uniref:LETM1 and EF-hand domain-containing protein n=1 Tax=Actinidia chinensis var. chinensis TaxID=1590841 RepID=A0A2R6QFS9_ACTCC|nr:LETM1 and EF-hand domain-containing protein [Actinidia chinensis var. chinensis]
MVKMEELGFFDLAESIKLRASAPYTSLLNEKGKVNYSIPRTKLQCGAMPHVTPSSSRVSLARQFLSGALALSGSSVDSYQTNSEDDQNVVPSPNPEIDFNRVHCLVWVLHESVRNFSLAIQAHELGRSGPELAKAGVAIEDVLIELMDLSHSLVSVHKLHSLATEAGFEEDFLLHFGTMILPGKNIEEVQENTLATLGLFASLVRETRLFLSEMGIKDLDEQVKDFLSYLECGILFLIRASTLHGVYSIKKEESPNNEVKAWPSGKGLALTDLGLGFETSPRPGVHGVMAKGESPGCELILGAIQPTTIRRKSACILTPEDYWAAYDRSGELPKLAERGASDSSPSSQVNSRANSPVILETHSKLIELMDGGGHQLSSIVMPLCRASIVCRFKYSTNSAMLDPITLAEVGYNAADSEPLHKSLFRKSTINLICASSDIWMGTRLLFVDILDAVGLLRKQLCHHKVTKRERKKIERTLADIASLDPITILMFLPVSTCPTF